MPELRHAGGEVHRRARVEDDHHRHVGGLAELARVEPIGACQQLPVRCRNRRPAVRPWRLNSVLKPWNGLRAVPTAALDDQPRRGSRSSIAATTAGRARARVTDAWRPAACQRPDRASHRRLRPGSSGRDGAAPAAQPQTSSKRDRASVDQRAAFAPRISAWPARRQRPISRGSRRAQMDRQAASRASGRL